MDVTPLVRSGAQIIQSYSSGVFRVSGAVYDSAIIVLADEVMVWPLDGGFESLDIESFSPIISRADHIDVVLLGCGDKTRFLPASLRSALKSQGVGVDVMDTGAACRTYNVLLAEGRRVAAALLPL